MRRLLLKGLLLLFLGLLSLCSTPVRAQNPAQVYLDPAEVTLSPGETAGFVLLIEGAADLFGVELHLVYDPAMVQILDADAVTAGVQLIPGSFLDPDGGFLVANKADNSRGELDYALTLLAPAEAVSGEGLILAFELQAIATGTSPLELSVILASADGASLPVIVDGGRVTVSAGQPSAPPPTSASEQPQAGSTPAQVAPASSTATAASSERAGSGDSATQSPVDPAETTGQVESATTVADASNPADAPPETRPASDPATTGSGTTAPVDQPGTFDPPASPAGRGGDDAIASISELSSATASESNSQVASGAGTSQVGLFILGSFLLLAVIIFFGRRLLRRKQ